MLMSMTIRRAFLKYITLNYLDVLVPLRSENITNVCKKAPKCAREYDEIERAGTEVTYRCTDCRGCLKCKNVERIDALSIQKEIEQGLIELVVKVDPENGITAPSLSFIVADPDSLMSLMHLR